MLLPVAARRVALPSVAVRRVALPSAAVRRAVPLSAVVRRVVPLSAVVRRLFFVRAFSGARVRSVCFDEDAGLSGKSS